MDSWTSDVGFGAPGMTMELYTVPQATRRPELRGLWEGPAWRDVPALRIGHFRPESSAHRPRGECKLLYSEDELFGIFRVADRYVRCVHTRFQDPVYRDSCVELFVQPRAESGYFNFEFNCGGALLSYYVLDPTRASGGFKDFIPLDTVDDARIRRHHSLPPVVDPELLEETTWYLEFAVPFAVLEKYTGALGSVAGSTWRANFYKCGDETSHPHWAAWSPIDELNFHLPGRFGSIRFEPGESEDES
jgi:hypothetical protein